jgi:hypothetical protein
VAKSHNCGKIARVAKSHEWQNRTNDKIARVAKSHEWQNRMSGKIARVAKSHEWQNRMSGNAARQQILPPRLKMWPHDSSSFLSGNENK